MSKEKQRAYEAVMGALVADAASLGFHWLYDPEKNAAIIGEIDNKVSKFMFPSGKKTVLAKHSE